MTGFVKMDMCILYKIMYKLVVDLPTTQLI